MFLCVYFDYGKNRSKAIIPNYWILCIILIVVAGIKYRIGGDPLSYDDDYPDFPTFDKFETTDFSLLKYEPLFYYIVACCKLISPDYFVFQFVQAAVINFAVFRVLKEHTKYIFTGALLYYLLFYLYFTEIMRETFCIALFLLFFKLILSKRYIIYYGVCIVGSFIHLSAAFMFVAPILYFLCRKGWRIPLIFLGITVLLFLVILSNPYIFIKIIPIEILIKIYNYNLLGIYWPTVILNYLHVLAIFILIRLNEKYNKNSSVLIPFAKIYILILLCTIAIQGIYRLSNYVCIIEIVLIVNVIKPIFLYAKKRQQSVLKFSTALCIILLLKTYSFTMHTDQYYPNSHFYNLYFPYETIFNPIRHPWRENIFYLHQEETYLTKKANDR